VGSSKHENIRVVENNIYDVMRISDVVIVASGTATVEAAIMGAPMIVVLSGLAAYLPARETVDEK